MHLKGRAAESRTDTPEFRKETSLINAEEEEMGSQGQKVLKKRVGCRGGTAKEKKSRSWSGFQRRKKKGCRMMKDREDGGHRIVKTLKKVRHLPEKRAWPHDVTPADRDDRKPPEIPDHQK